MKKQDLQANHEYLGLIEQIGHLLRQGREQAARAVNTVMVTTYWQIGRYIVEFEQGGRPKHDTEASFYLHYQKT